jgi:hypothetical protein
MFVFKNWQLEIGIWKLQIGQTRRYPQPKSQKNKNFLQFLNSLPNNDLSSLTQYSSRFTRYEFGPNAQLRPIVERRCFSAPSDIVQEFCFGHLSLKNSNLFRI